MAKLRVTQVRSGIGGTANQRATLKTLGLRRLHARVEREDRPEVIGMIRTVEHLVTVERVEESGS